ncbi:menthofuran synthase, partial [Genlisea aurea]
YRMIIADKVLYGSKDLAFAPYGEYWRQMKSICVLHLLSNKKVQSFGKVREEETSIMIAKMTGNGSSTVNLSDMIVSLINNVVCRVVLGRKFDNEDDEQGRLLKRAIKNLSQVVGNVNVEDFVPWLGWINIVSGANSKVDRICKGLDELLEAILRERREKRRKDERRREGEEEASNFVDILLDFQEGSLNSPRIDDYSIKAIIL